MKALFIAQCVLYIPLSCCVSMGVCTGCIGSICFSKEISKMEDDEIFHAEKDDD